MDAEMKFEQMAEQVGAFHREEGRWPSRKSESDVEKRLGVWISRQRANARKCTLTGNRAAALDKAAPGWTDTNRDGAWRANAKRLGAFVEDRGHFPLRAADSEDERALASWLNNARTSAREGRLDPERAAILGEFKAPTASGASWMDKLEEVRAFVDREGRFPRTDLGETDERSLGRWLSYQRKRARQGTEHPPRLEALDENLPGWRGVDPETAWSDRAQAVAEFHNREGRWPSTVAKGSGEKSLGVWLANQRTRLRKDMLRPDRRAFLDKAAPGWYDLYREAWEGRATGLALFYMIELRWPDADAEDAAERKLGRWLDVQKMRARRGELSRERIASLDAVAHGWNDMSQGADFDVTDED